MNRKTLTALGVFVILAALALFALRQPEKGERAADHPHPVPRLDPAQITTLEVTRGGATTIIKNDAGKYRVIAPIAYAADEASAKAAFEGLGKLDVSDLVTDQKTKQSEFDVDDKSGIRVVAKHDDKVLADLIVGKSVGAGTMVRPSGQDDTWQATGITHYLFDKGPGDWRDKSIVTFPAADVGRLDITAKDGAKIALQKTAAKDPNKGPKQDTKQGPKDDQWEVTQSSVKIDKLDASVPSGIASALAAWKANDFADGVSLADAGLAPPELTVTLSAIGTKAGAKDDKSVTVLIGGKKGDDVYVKKADAPQVFLVKKYNLERINKRPMEFRDKTLCDLTGAELTEIAVSAGDKSYTLSKRGAEWKAVKPAKLEVDSAKVNPIVGAFKDWKGNGFAEDQSLKDNGLAKPKAVISAKAGGKSSAPACQVRVGDETKDKVNYYVASSRSADVYTAPKWAVDRILVKPDDLKSATAKTPAVKPVVASKSANKSGKR